MLETVKATSLQDKQKTQSMFNRETVEQREQRRAEKEKMEVSRY